MLEIRAAGEESLQQAFDLMYENMHQYHEALDLPWDPEWLEANYADKENYSLQFNGESIGFLSIEWQEDTLYIHTLQLTKAAQGRIHGMSVFQWMVSEARNRNLGWIRCRTFRDNPALGLYRKLGFKVTGESRVLLDLELAVDEATAGASRRRRQS